MFGRRLAVGLQATEYAQAVIIGQEFSIVWEVVDKPVAGDADENSG